MVTSFPPGARLRNYSNHGGEFTFPNLYNGNPDFLHHVRVRHQRGSLIHSDTVLVRMRPGPLADLNMDGIPDSWEDSHGLSSSKPDGIYGAEGDYDGDGLSNFVEYLIGTSPILSDAHFFPVVEPSTNPGGDIVFQFPVIAGRQYQPLYSSDLQTW